ncbi:MAG: NAD(P)/FAD-dependent oxidoreductase, partial [Balneolaceae bacterium]
AAEAMDSALSWIREVEQASGSRLAEKNGVVRPALTAEIGKDFKKAPEKYDWPNPNWVEWLDRDAFSERFPFITKQEGGLMIHEAYTVRTPLLVSETVKQLSEKESFYTVFEEDYEIETTSGAHHIRLGDGREFTADHLIYATGSALADSELWSWLPLSQTKGQTITLHLDGPVGFAPSLSAVGYIANHPAEPNQLTVGSTYEHHFDHPHPDSKGHETLLKKTNEVLPHIIPRIESITSWAGVRLFTPDYLPVAGRHPDIENIYVIGGFGSKGMIYSSLLAGYVSDLILHQQPVPDHFCAQRFAATYSKS